MSTELKWLTKRLPNSFSTCSDFHRLPHRQCRMKQGKNTPTIAEKLFHEGGETSEVWSMPPKTILPPYRSLGECIQKAINFNPGRFPEFLLEGKCKLLVDIADGTVHLIPKNKGRPFSKNRITDNQNPSPVLASDAASTQADPSKKANWPHDCMNEYPVDFHCRISWMGTHKGSKTFLPNIPISNGAPGSEATPTPCDEHAFRIAEVVEVRADGRKGERRFPIALDWRIIETAMAKIKQSPPSQNITSRWASYIPRHIGSANHKQNPGPGNINCSAPRERPSQSTSPEASRRPSVVSLSQWHSKESLLRLIPTENSTNKTHDQNRGSGRLGAASLSAHTLPSITEENENSDSESSGSSANPAPKRVANLTKNHKNGNQQSKPRTPNLLFQSSLSSISEEE